MPLTRPVRISGEVRALLHPRYQHDVKIWLAALDAMTPADRERMMTLIEWTVQARKCAKWGWVADPHPGAARPPEDEEVRILGEAV